MLTNAKKRKKFVSILRIAIIAALGLAIVGGIVSSAMDSYIWGRRNDARVRADESLRNIENHIEFNGLDDAAKQMMEEHRQLYALYANFIIINKNFDVVYAANQGHLDGTGKFYAAADVENPDLASLLFVLDADGNLISSHHMNTGSLIPMVNLSQPLLPKIKAIVGGGMTTQEGPNFRVESYSDTAGWNYRTYNIYDGVSGQNVIYHGFPTKDLHLFYFSDVNNQLIQQEYERTDVLENFRMLVVALAVISFVIYWLLLPVWVFINASRRDNHPALWSILTLFTNIVGMIVYLVVRPEAHQCQHCKEPIERDYVVCPICGTRNRMQCKKCEQIIDEDWNFCPRCATPIEHEAAESADASAVAVKDGE